MVAFPCKIGAPVTGITLSTRVGRLSRTHFDTGFPLNSISPMGRKVMELHGGESERLVGVSTSCWSSLLNDRSFGNWDSETTRLYSETGIRKLRRLYSETGRVVFGNYAVVFGNWYSETTRLYSETGIRKLRRLYSETPRLYSETNRLDSETRRLYAETHIRKLDGCFRKLERLYSETWLRKLRYRTLSIHITIHISLMPLPHPPHLPPTPPQPSKALVRATIYRSLLPQHPPHPTRPPWYATINISLMPLPHPPPTSPPPHPNPRKHWSAQPSTEAYCPNIPHTPPALHGTQLST